MTVIRLTQICRNILPRLRSREMVFAHENALEDSLLFHRQMRFSWKNQIVTWLTLSMQRKWARGSSGKMACMQLSRFSMPKHMEKVQITVVKFDRKESRLVERLFAIIKSNRLNNWIVNRLTSQEATVLGIVGHSSECEFEDLLV